MGLKDRISAVGQGLKLMADAFSPSGTNVRAFESASLSRRMGGWNPGLWSAQAIDQSGDVTTILKRSRDAKRSNPLFGAAERSYVADAVGDGIVPVFETETDALYRQIRNGWEQFVEEADADGQCSLYGLQALVVESVREGGEVFARKRFRRSGDPQLVPIQYQLLESELVPRELNRGKAIGRRREIDRQPRIVAGIEMDRIGRRTAYHFHRTHPGHQVLNLQSADLVRLLAREVLHMYPVHRPGQLRGLPIVHAALTKLRAIDVYDDFEIDRKQTRSAFAGFITKPDPDEDPLNASGAQLDEDDIPLPVLQGGTIQELNPGEEITFAEPEETASVYEQFMRVQLRIVASSLGVTYEQLTGDYSGVNYTSSRAARTAIQRQIDQFVRNVVVFQFCRPVWNDFLTMGQLAGLFEIPDMRALRVRHRVTPGWQYVDPEKELRADILAVRAGFRSRADVVAEKGRDIVDITEDQVKDIERLDEAGLMLDSDPRHGKGASKQAALTTDTGGSGDGGEGGENNDQAAADAA